MIQETNSDRTRRYLEAVASLGPAENVEAFFAPDVMLHELPNRIAPHGRVRRAADLRPAYEQGKRLLSWQSYEVRRLIEVGDEVAAEVEWTGALALPFKSLPAGAEIKAHVAMFLTFRDGKIVSQRNYDCYPPFEGANAAVK
jgi:ketosteroid isomerase-like protein